MEENIYSNSLEHSSGDENNDEKVAELLKDFQNEVVRKHFPKAVIGHSVFTTLAGQKPESVDARLHGQQYVFKGTSFYFPAQNKKFIHYTKFSNFIEILKSREIRLYDFSNFNDPSELFFAKEIAKDLNGEFVGNEKESLFAFSFNEFIKEDFNMWRLYGDDGFGVAFEFEFLGTEKQQDAWSYHYLSEVKYNKSEGAIVEAFLNDCKNFFEQERYAKIEGIKSFILPVIGWIKKEIYANEREIRLLSIRNNFFHFVPNNKLFYNYSLSRSQKLVRYSSIPISNENEYSERLNNATDGKDLQGLAYLPHVKITKVILGYRYGKEDVSIKREMLYRLFRHYNYKGSISVNPSYFASAF